MGNMWNGKWNVMFTSPDQEVCVSVNVWEKNRFRAAWVATDLLYERFGFQPKYFTVKVDRVILDDDPSTW